MELMGIVLLISYFLVIPLPSVQKNTCFYVLTINVGGGDFVVALNTKTPNFGIMKKIFLILVLLFSYTNINTSNA